MHLRLCAVVMSLLCEVIRTGYGALQKQSGAHRETPGDCRTCLECSRDNGCVRCPERLFLFLQREGMSHHGTCLHACPAGHYGQRGRDINRCMKCRSPDCEQCFSRDFCTRCKPGFKLYKGRCLSSCPAGTFAHQTDCLENCPVAPQGEWGEWSEWSVCARDGATCGFRWGRQTRFRAVSQPGRTPEGEEAPAPCPTSHGETQRCRMKKKCPKERRRNKKTGLGRKRERKRIRLLAGVGSGNSPNGTTDTSGGDGSVLRSEPPETQK
ncbi:R-spondin-4 [Cololabis saira]|uniref:R-spondin-4 n=1 Tax=Cololabis saira TaxID=129043 RepID=UPI002AD4B56F|nr:R-spondin-4 [Cololabis saira]